MVIAIDGPAGSGKSTIAKHIARKSSAIYINSGSMYRAITFFALKNDYISNLQKNKKSIITMVQTLRFHFLDDEIEVNGQRLGNELRTDPIDEHVSQVSSIPELRSIVNSKIKEMSKKNHVIVEGRDMTTVAFPKAEYKFYFDATVEARAQRRLNQGTSQLSYNEIKRRIEERDRLDREKAVGGLKIAQDAHYLDTSDLTIDQVCDIVLQSIQGLNSQEK